MTIDLAVRVVDGHCANAAAVSSVGRRPSGVDVGASRGSGPDHRARAGAAVMIWMGAVRGGSGTPADAQADYVVNSGGVITSRQQRSGDRASAR